MKLAHARPGDIVQGVAVFVAATRIEVSLRRRGLPATAAKFGVRLAEQEPHDRTTPHEPIPRWAIRRAKLTQLLMRFWPFGDTCLRKSLVMGNRLAALSPRLVIGVRTSSTDGSMLAHAWLNIRGIDIDPTSADYLTFDLT